MAVLVLFVRYLADPLMAWLARTPDLLVIGTIGWAATAAAIGGMIGLGKELGGLVASVSIGSTPYRDMVAARLAALRDFLLLFFFLSIGAVLDLSNLRQDIARAAVFSLGSRGRRSLPQRSKLRRSDHRRMTASETRWAKCSPGIM